MSLLVSPPADFKYTPDVYFINVLGGAYLATPTNMAAVPSGNVLIYIAQEPEEYWKVCIRVDTDIELAALKTDNLNFNQEFPVGAYFMKVPNTAVLPVAGVDSIYSISR